MAYTAKVSPRNEMFANQIRDFSKKYSILGIVDVTGQIMGMMPHPERNIGPFHHPDFGNMPKNHVPDGLQMFINAVEYIKELR